jgi:hypothetical protein
MPTRREQLRPETPLRPRRRPVVRRSARAFAGDREVAGADREPGVTSRPTGGSWPDRPLPSAM